MSSALIHPFIIARDAEQTIATTLASLRSFSDVTVYDNGSTDRTLEICAQFPNVKVTRGDFIGFGPTKNLAASLAPGDWVLSLDADEYLSEPLTAELGTLALDDPTVAYAIERCNLFMGKHIRRGGWGDDWLVRLYHRRHLSFNDALVHERVVVPKGARTVRLRAAMWHLAVTDIDQFLQKISRYSELRRRVTARRQSAARIFVRSAWAFFRSYVLKLGLLEGWRGLVIAYANSVGTFFRHMKRYVDTAVAREQRHCAARQEESGR
jgi:glycosyltransferase involved in cell wall biosynthesis